MNIRLKRIESLLKREISEYIHTKIRKKNDGIGFVSVTKVEISPDFSEAKIFLSFFSEDKKENQYTFKVLNQYRGKMQSEISRVLRLKKTPFFHFIEDTSIKEGDRILEIIEKNKKQENSNPS